MADRRISVLSDATDTTGMYIALDKPGSAEALRYPFVSVVPTSIYRCQFETVMDGTTTIVFGGIGPANPFPVGTTYEVVPIWASADGSIFNLEITNKTINGFDVTTPVACTFLYLAIIPN